MKKVITGTIGAALIGVAHCWEPGRPVPTSTTRTARKHAPLGVTPLYDGDPGYAPRLDRDGDGIACEIDPR
jgi:hypothetical protein